MSTNLGIGLSVTRPTRGFDPARLFANGEQGAWYDPSDFATLYQDSAGTTPVTALGQPVGLMLDKSQGGKPTGELVTSGDFTGWIPQTGWSVVDGVAVAASTTSNLLVNLSLQANTFYEITVTCSSLTAGSWSVLCGFSTVSPSISAAGTYTFRLVRGSNSFLYIDAVSSLTATFTNISVREIPGNHAAQATAAARPTVQARANLLERTEEFENTGIWTRQEIATVSANETTAPNGTTTADLLVPSTNSSNVHRITETLTTISGQTYNLSVYAKAENYSGLRMSIDSPATLASVDLSAGTTSNGTIESVGSGWYRVSFSFTAGASTVVRFWVFETGADAVAATSYSGDGTSGIYLWGAQLEVGSTATTYQRVTTATDYADIGLPRYLEFDGVDDAISTASVDFSASDEMTVCGGVYKASDAAVAVSVELSTSASSNNGSFVLFAPSANAEPRYAYGSRGTAVRYAEVNNATYSAPQLSVLSGLSDISQPVVTLRRDGTQIATIATTQGTGNYGDHPLYIGARAASSLYFNGRIHQLIVRGATTAGALLDQTERYVARKTGVTL